MSFTFCFHWVLGCLGCCSKPAPTLNSERSATGPNFGVHLKLLDNPAGLMVVGDKGFDSDKLRAQLEELGARHCFPSKSNRRKKRRLNKKLYRQRYRVENYFCRLKRWACSSTRRDKLARHFLSIIEFASVIDWLRYGLGGFSNTA